MVGETIIKEIIKPQLRQCLFSHVQWLILSELFCNPRLTTGKSHIDIASLEKQFQPRKINICRVHAIS